MTRAQCTSRVIVAALVRLLVKGFSLEPVSEDLDPFPMVRLRPPFFIKTLTRHIASRDASNVLNVLGCRIEVVHRGGFLKVGIPD